MVDLETLISTARTALTKTTITYASFNTRVKSGFYTNKGINPSTGTEWGKFFAAMDKAQENSTGDVKAAFNSARAEVRKTTITYPDWHHRVNSGFYKRKNINPTTGTAWGRSLAHLDDAAQAVDAPTPLPSNTTLDYFRIILEPNNTDPGGPVNASAFWVNFNSPVTPRPAPNHQSPTARYLYSGDHVYILKGICRESGYPWRWFNLHDVAGDTRWGVVSGFALDMMDTPDAQTGSNHTATVEYETVQDTDRQPHSGGAHWALPTPAVGEWLWLLIELKVGNSENGILRIWDWTTGEKYVDVQNINTVAGGANWMQAWEGGYNSNGVSSAQRILQTPALFADASDGIAAVLHDTPKLVDRWGTISKSSGGAASRVELGAGTITIPASPLLK